LQLIFSLKLLNTVVDFIMNTDSFAHFGIRLLEIMSLQFTQQVVKSEALGIVTGLLRTNDYETVAQCLSFLSVLTESASLIDSESAVEGKPSSLVKAVLSKRLLILVMKTVEKSPEVEFLHFASQIVGHAIAHKELRKVVIEEPLKPTVIPATEEGDACKVFNYACLLRTQIEKLPEVVSIRKLHLRVVR
jgi:hypothetical protein